MLYGASEQVFGWQAEARDETGIIPTGYRAFDSVLKRGGLRRGHLAALLGRSNVGKTALACNLIVRMVRGGSSVLFSSQEMTAPEVTNRVMSIAYELPVNELENWMRDGKVKEPLLNKFRQDFSRFAIYDKKSPTFTQLREQLAQFQKMTGEKPAVLIQDYMTYMEPPSRYGGMSERMLGIARQFEILAKEEGVATIVLVQTGRANEGDITRRNHGHIPLSMEDAWGGGEQAFDVMFAVYRPELDPVLYEPDLEGSALTEALMKREQWRNKAVLQVVKNRFGPRNVEGGVVDIDWTSMRFEEHER